MCSFTRMCILLLMCSLDNNVPTLCKKTCIIGSTHLAIDFTRRVKLASCLISGRTCAFVCGGGRGVRSGGVRGFVHVVGSRAKRNFIT